MSHQLGRNALLALGMHRSGTSALTGVLAQLGVQLGRHLYAPQQGVNDKGFFEHSDITDCNDRILYRAGSAWDDILPLAEGWQDDPGLDDHKARLRGHIRRDFSKAALWALKDPRICRLLPLWQPLLREEGIDVRYLFIVRHPMEVAQSLARRDGFSTDKALLLWLDHNLQVERHTRGQRRLVTGFDALLNDPIGQLQRLQARLALDLPIAQAGDAVGRFLSPQLRHHADALRVDPGGVMSQGAWQGAEKNKPPRTSYGMACSRLEDLLLSLIAWHRARPLPTLPGEYGPSLQFPGGDDPDESRAPL